MGWAILRVPPVGQEEERKSSYAGKIHALGRRAVQMGWYVVPPGALSKKTLILVPLLIPSAQSGNPAWIERENHIKHASKEAGRKKKLSVKLGPTKQSKVTFHKGLWSETHPWLEGEN